MASTAHSQIDLNRVAIRIQGESPLVFPRNSTAGTPQQQYESTLYPHVIEPATDLRCGRYGIEADHLYSALEHAAGHSLNGTITITGGRLLEISGAPPRMRADRVSDPEFPIAYRAEFYPWQIHIRLLYDKRRISQLEILHLFNSAGMTIGIGAHRPERGGTNGTFTVMELDGSPFVDEQRSLAETR